jgi:hypothetical protein
MNWRLLVPVFLVTLMFWVPIAFAASALRLTTGSGATWWVLRDRVDVITGTAESVGVLAITWALGPWDVVPPAAWGLALGTAVFALLLGVRAWSDLPPRRPGSGRATRWGTAGIDIAIAVGLIVLVT